MDKLVCYGGVGTVTGANFLLETGGKKILVDCGLEQGSDTADESNREDFLYDPKEIDALFITHAHIDHIGLVPKLVKSGFQGRIYSTPVTKEIARLMLEDAAKIMERNERSEDGKEAIYKLSDVDKAFHLWQTIEYGDQEAEGVKLRVFNSGHILGSAMYEFALSNGKNILFSGDIGNSPSVLMKDVDEVEGLSYIVMDSVYGDRNHKDKELRSEKLKLVVEKVVKKGGTLLIPVFSLERTQVILKELDHIFETKSVPAVPVFVDSPLAIKVTEIYERVSKHYNDASQKEIKEGDNIFDFHRLKKTAQVRDSQEIINIKGPKIILAGSGMSTAGRIVGHEEIYLPDPNATILFVGYQASGTLGRQIEEGLKKVYINDKAIKVRAKVETIEGYSAHADSDALVKFVSHSQSTLEKVFVAMGEPKSSIFLAQRLRDELGITAVVPEEGREYYL